MRQSNKVFYLSKRDVNSICSTDVIIVIWAYLVFLRGIKTLSHHVMLNPTCTYMPVCYIFHQSRTRNKEPINYLPSDFKNNLHTVNGKHKIRPVDISSWISRKSINWLLLKNYWIFSDKIWYVFVGDIMNQIYKTSINLRDTINVTNVFWAFWVIWAHPRYPWYQFQDIYWKKLIKLKLGRGHGPSDLPLYLDKIICALMWDNTWIFH